MKPTIPKIMISGETPAHYEILLPLPVLREGWRLDTLGGIYQLSFDYKEHVIVIYAPHLIMGHEISVIYHQKGSKRIINDKTWITNDTREGVIDTLNFMIESTMCNLKPPAKSVKNKHKSEAKN